MVFIIINKTAEGQTYIYMVKAEGINEACSLAQVHKEDVIWTGIKENALTALPFYDKAVISKLV